MGTDYVENWRNFQKDPDLNNIGQASIDQNTSSKYQPVKK